MTIVIAFCRRIACETSRPVRGTLLFKQSTLPRPGDLKFSRDCWSLRSHLLLHKLLFFSSALPMIMVMMMLLPLLLLLMMMMMMKYSQSYCNCHFLSLLLLLLSLRKYCKLTKSVQVSRTDDADKDAVNDTKVTPGRMVTLCW